MVLGLPWYRCDLQSFVSMLFPPWISVGETATVSFGAQVELFTHLHSLFGQVFQITTIIFSFSFLCSLQAPLVILPCTSLYKLDQVHTKIYVFFFHCQINCSHVHSVSISAQYLYFQDIRQALGLKISNFIAHIVVGSQSALLCNKQQQVN